MLLPCPKNSCRSRGSLNLPYVLVCVSLSSRSSSNISCRFGKITGIAENLCKIIVKTGLLINQEANAYNDSQKQSVFYQVLTLFTEALNLNIHNFVDNDKPYDFKKNSSPDGNMADGSRNKGLYERGGQRIEK